jgi:protein-L-isoaspartate O-methyltransferase
VVANHPVGAGARWRGVFSLARIVEPVMTGTDLIPAIDLSGTEEEQALAIRDAMSLDDIGRARDTALREIETAAKLIQSAMATARAAANSAHGYFSLRGEDLTQLTHGSFDRFMAIVKLDLDRAIWRHCINASKLATVFDKTERDKFERGLNGTDVPEATPDNLAATLRALILCAPAILSRGVVELFKNLSREHKTNDRFTIGDKFILNHVLTEDDGWQHFSYGWMQDHLVDLERQLCVILGRTPPDHMANVVAKMREHGLRTEPREVETDLLRVKWFKKGTVHAWIKDPEHVAKVNRIIAEHFGEVLPEGHSAEAAAKAEGVNLGNGWQMKPKAPSAPKATTIADDVLDVLRRSRIEAAYLILPGQLDRALYVRTDKVLRDFGGAWNRRAKAHEFAADKLSALVGVIWGNGSYQSPSDQGQFFTAPALARRVVELAEIEHDMRVLEPSAGKGALIEEINVWPHKPMAIEVDRELAEYLRRRFPPRQDPSDWSIVWGDFLSRAPEMGGLFDRVIMNPPYANGAAVEHTVAAWNCLKPGGRLVAILPLGVQSRQDRQHGFFRELVNQFGRFETVEDGAFKEAGTDVRACIAVLDKPEGAK